jgi:hypothetical protein
MIVPFLPTRVCLVSLNFTSRLFYSVSKSTKEDEIGTSSSHPFKLQVLPVTIHQTKQASGKNAFSDIVFSKHDLGCALSSPNHVQANNVTSLALTLPWGPRFELYKEKGLSHLLKCMLFKVKEPLLSLNKTMLIKLN